MQTRELPLSGKHGGVLKARSYKIKRGVIKLPFNYMGKLFNSLFNGFNSHSVVVAETDSVFSIICSSLTSRITA